MTVAAAASPATIAWPALPTCSCPEPSVTPTRSTVQVHDTTGGHLHLDACAACEGHVAVITCGQCNSFLALPAGADVATFACDAEGCTDPLGAELRSCDDCGGEGRIEELLGDRFMGWRDCSECEGSGKVGARFFLDLYADAMALRAVGHPLAEAILDFGLAEA